MLCNTIIRRARRRHGIFSVWAWIYNQLKWSYTPARHVKIDDEERLLDNDQSPIPWKHNLIRIFVMIILGLLALLILAVLIAYIIYKPPKIIIRFLQWNNPDVLFEVTLPSNQRVVALTLDDAPSSETAKILDLLKAYGAKATFFVIGSQIASHRDLLQRIQDEGHEMGNHAWADEPSIKLPLMELERQINEVEAMLPANADGAKYFRPGSGIFNRKMVEMVKSLGYKTVLGGIFPFDPQIHSPKTNAAHVLSMVRPGAIIIMHDRRSYSPKQLELVLKGLVSRGWNVESVGGLLRKADEITGRKGG